LFYLLEPPCRIKCHKGNYWFLAYTAVYVSMTGLKISACIGLLNALLFDIK